MSAVTRERFSILLAPGLWRGIDVLVEPPTQTHPLRHFKAYAEALAFAEQLSALEGWPVRDRTGGVA